MPQRLLKVRERIISHAYREEKYEGYVAMYAVELDFYTTVGLKNFLKFSPTYMHDL